MNTNKTCGNCKFFKRFHEDWRSGMGECHKYAPRPIEHNKAFWSAVSFDDWCGEFEETTIKEKRND